MFALSFVHRGSQQHGIVPGVYVLGEQLVVSQEVHNVVAVEVAVVAAAAATGKFENRNTLPPPPPSKMKGQTEHMGHRL